MNTDPTAYHFDQALLPVTWDICGVRLRPFSMGHYIILKNIGNPMLDNSETNIADDEKLCWFFQTLLICASTYEDNIEMLQNLESHKETMDKLVANLMKVMESDPHWNIFEHLRSFRDYVNFYMDVPVYFNEHESKEVTKSGIDWVQNLYFTMKKHGGYSESEIMNMNFKKLLYVWCSYAESEGSIKVINKQDLQQLARARGLI